MSPSLPTFRYLLFGSRFTSALLFDFSVLLSFLVLAWARVREGRFPVWVEFRLFLTYSSSLFFFIYLIASFGEALVCVCDFDLCRSSAVHLRVETRRFLFFSRALFYYVFVRFLLASLLGPSLASMILHRFL